MYDCVSVKKLSDRQIQDLMVSIGGKLDGASEATAEMLMWQQDILRQELEERQMMHDLKNAPLPSMNLTRDALSDYEDNHKNETKNKK